MIFQIVNMKWWTLKIVEVILLRVALLKTIVQDIRIRTICRHLVKWHAIQKTKLPPAPALFPFIANVFTCFKNYQTKTNI